MKQFIFLLFFISIMGLSNLYAKQYVIHLDNNKKLFSSYTVTEKYQILEANILPENLTQIILINKILFDQIENAYQNNNDTVFNYNSETGAVTW
jgi:hypothetical protein